MRSLNEHSRPGIIVLRAVYLLAYQWESSLGTALSRGAVLPSCRGCAKPTTAPNVHRCHNARHPCARCARIRVPFLLTVCLVRRCWQAVLQRHAHCLKQKGSVRISQCPLAEECLSRFSKSACYYCCNFGKGFSLSLLNGA